MFNDKLTSLVVVLNFGSLMLLAMLNFTNPLKVNRVANRWFGVFLLLWTTFFYDELSVLLLSHDLEPIWEMILRFVQFYSPMVFYFSIIFYSNPATEFNKLILPHLVLPAIYLAGIYFYYFEGGSARLNDVLIIIMLSQTLFYCLISFFRIRKHQRRVLLYASNAHEVNLFWLERLTIGVLVMIVAIITYNIMFYMESLNLVMSVIQLLVIYVIAFHSLRQKEIYPFSKQSRIEILSIEEQEPEEVRRKIVPDEEIVELKSKLHQFMLSDKPYIDPEINLVKLAEMFGTSPHKLSYIINTGFNRNFFNFINAYRVEEAKVLLMDPKMDHYSVLGIAFESGFNSKTSFNSTFKNITGLTPTEYKKTGTTL